MIEHINALLRVDLFPAVKRALKGHGGSSVNVLCSTAQMIVDAITAGWFVLPNGRNNSYSRQQFFQVNGLFSSTPWSIALSTHADQSAARLLSRVGQTRFDSLWSHPQGLAGPQALARALPQRNPRMPFEWASGAVDVVLVVNALLDSHKQAKNLTRLIDCMASTEALTKDASIDQQYDTFVDAGQSDYVQQMLMSTRRLFLDRESKRALYECVTLGRRGRAFEMFLLERAAHEENSYRAAWREIFNRVHHVAGVFEGMPGCTEHAGTVNRRLKLGAGASYRMNTCQTNTGSKLTLSLGGDHSLGLHVEIETHWEFRNWVMALSDTLLETEATYLAYMEAEVKAKARIDVVGDTAPAAAHAWRPYDDFEPDEVRRRCTSTLQASA